MPRKSISGFETNDFNVRKNENIAVKLSDIRSISKEEIEELKKALFDARDIMNNVVCQALRISDSYRRFHYVTTSESEKKVREKIGREQDARVQARAEEDWKESLQAANIYLKRIQEEFESVKKTLGY